LLGIPEPVKVHLGVDPDFRPARKAHAGLLVRELDALIGNRLELMEPRSAR